VTGKDFLNAIANDQTDVVQLLLGLLEETGAAYCVIGGLAVNAYIVVIAGDIEKVCDAARDSGMIVEQFQHSINLSVEGSDLRIQIQTDARFQDFVSRAIRCEVLGYTMYVACLDDVLQGKLWAYSDEQRRKSKRQKDLSDIMRLVENHPDLKKKLPSEIRSLVD
jgi:hypothetical protein